MKNTFKKITALTLSILTVGAFTSCVKEKPEDISDSQESSSSQSQPESTERTEITVAFFNAQSSEVPDAINSFRSLSDMITVKIRDYSDGKTLEEMESAELEGILTRLKMDMISGEEFDVLVYSSYDMVLSGSVDYCADLYECMDNFGSAKREDFLTDILSAAEVNGKLPAIMTNFHVATSKAKTKHIPQEYINWTVDDVLTVIETLPEGMWFFESGISKNQIASYLLEASVFDYVNFGSNTCSFDSPDFIKLLEIIAAMDIDEGISDSEGMSVMQDKALITQTQFSHLNDSAIYSFFCDNGEEMTFLGYPTNDGGTSYPIADEFISIIETSDHKEEAWEFLSFLLTESYVPVDLCERGLGIPVGMKHFRSFMDAEGEGTIRGEVSLYWADGKTVSLTEEQISDYEDYILNTNGTFYRDYNISSIVWEELQALLGGEKSPEECARIIQNRVTIYLSERS